MKLITKYMLIAFIVLRASHEVQGKTYEYNLENEGKRTKREQEDFEEKTKRTFEESALKNEYLATVNKQDSQPTNTTATNSQENVLTKCADSDHVNITQANHDMCTERNHSTTAKYFDTEILNSTKEIHVIKPPVRKFLPTQRIYCRQIRKTEVNNHGQIVESIQHICAALQNTTIPLGPALPLSRRDKNCGTSVTSTPKGINCRRVMNSEFNDLGEIVDSVTELCDPPTTTTTTTRKPIVYTWPKTTTTTLKPLVKVCRPVMDSYLNEEDKIIDSVSIYCKMEQAN